jgi:hypothetical protein
MSDDKEPEAAVLLTLIAITVLLFVAMALGLVLPALWRWWPATKPSAPSPTSTSRIF